MKFLSGLFSFILFMALGYASDKVTGRIVYIDRGEEIDRASLIFLDDGKILKSTIEQANKLALLDLDTIVHFNIDSNRFITSVLISNDVVKKESNKNLLPPLVNFEPTVLQNMDEATNVFKNFRRKETPWSQCYNRAHVWAYETKNRFNINTMKVFMFYTTKYIREYNFPWWFHVAPLTLVSEDGGISEKVLDPYFAKNPLTLKDWTKLFIQNRPTCPVISQYSDFQKNERDEYCYLYKSSMYYVQPIDLENFEKYGKTKTQWKNFEIKRAYRNSYGFLR
jgi:hypothetical protein